MLLARLMSTRGSGLLATYINVIGLNGAISRVGFVQRLAVTTMGRNGDNSGDNSGDDRDAMEITHSGTRHHTPHTTGLQFRCDQPHALVVSYPSRRILYMLQV